MNTYLPLSTQILQNLASSALVGALVTAVLLYFSLRDHTRTGPRIKDEIAQHYAHYTVYALARLGMWCFIICMALATVGGSLYFLAVQALSLQYSSLVLFLACLLSVALVSTYLFSHYLLHIPSLLISSVRFRFSRLTPFWKQLNPQRLKLARWFLMLCVASIYLAGFYQLLTLAQWPSAIFYTLQGALYVCFYIWVTDTKSTPVTQAKPRSEADKKTPNILMIGSDTLRADRLGAADYVRNLTPNIDQLAEQGVTFSNCYTPLARTAPSLASLFTGTWPHKHGIRTNYPYPDQLALPVDNLIETLNKAGYETAAIADWAGADLAKINFGFTQNSVPDDQWNLKYLLRQGPATIRLFLSLFCHNRFGKKCLPELYYLAGIPLTKQLFSDTRTLISEMADKDQPFFINLFTATTHVPFGSDYPYYNLFTPNNYTGDSQFIMTKLASPEEIMEKQVLGPEAFDVPQILNLYDGCVVQFDDEVGKLITHLEACGLADNTIVVIYSDHGADFFETGSWGQGNTLMGSDPSGKVPLIIRDPRQAQAHIVEQTTRTIDVAPTLLELLQLPALKTADGVSLAPVIRNPEEMLDLYAYQETGLWLSPMPGAHPQHLCYPNILELLDIPNKNTGMLCIKNEFYTQVIKAKDRALSHGDWKLIALPTDTGMLYRLYDLKNDPDCSHNIADSQPEIFSRLKARLDALINDDPIVHN